MLNELKDVIPTIVSEQIELIKAMKNNDKVIYIRGSLYKKYKKKVIKSMALKYTKWLGKVGVGIPIVLAFLGGPIGWVAILLGAVLIGVSKKDDDFNNYKSINNPMKEQTELFKNKGRNKYKFKTDNIIDC